MSTDNGKIKIGTRERTGNEFTNRAKVQVNLRTYKGGGVDATPHKVFF